MYLKTSKVLIASIIAATSLFTLGCEDEDDNKLVGAQECLDKLSSSDPAIAAKALTCANMVSGINSTHANIIRCSAYFMVGGITPVALITAFQNYDSASANDKPGVLMAALIQSDAGAPGVPDIPTAELTYNYCKASGVPSLIFISSMSFTGTTMASIAGTTTPGGPGGFLDTCASGSCDDTAIGNAVISMYDSYCVGDTASTPACQDIGSAISSGGSPADIAQALYDALQ
jgi:hypothetical protein